LILNVYLIEIIDLQTLKLPAELQSSNDSINNLLPKRSINNNNNKYLYEN